MPDATSSEPDAPPVTPTPAPSLGAASPAPATSPRQPVLVCIGVLLIAGVAAYATSLGGAFVLDDQVHIIDDSRIRSVLPLSETIARFDRGLVRLSLAVNYQLSEALTGDGLDPVSYNLFNLVIHLLAGLTLFGIARRMIAHAAVRDDWRRHAHGLALAIALLWLVHPLTTQAVTYTVQRAESMAALFYLLAVYAVVRSSAASAAVRWRGPAWLAVAALACVLGAMCKPIVVTAPVVMLLVDRAMTGSLKATLRTRWPFYGAFVLGGLALSGYLLWHTAGRETTAGFGVVTITPLEYLANQGPIILHYLRLALWPMGLTFDHAWAPIASTMVLAGAGVAVLALLATALWALYRWPVVGTPAAAFFIILSPTSSFVPYDDLAVEHRMYLPLAALAALAVAGAWRLIVRFDATGRIGVGVLCVAALALGAGTAVRNLDYHSPRQLWHDTVAKAPHNQRAHQNLAAAYFDMGEFAAAQRWYERAMELDDEQDVAEIRVGLARALVQQASAAEARGDAHAAMAHYNAAAAHYQHVIDHVDEPYAPALHGMGTLLARHGHHERAEELLRQATDADPSLAEAHADLALVLDGLDDSRGAIEALRRAVSLRGDHAQWHMMLGMLLLEAGDLEAAVEPLERAVALDPGNRTAREGLDHIHREIGHTSPLLR